ncbi:mRNA-capping enzyme subunit beta [Kappamyces sp. JEL0829]|nr:mRNA-capping enzyme subunit beta [Kappamyces sp. JEL0829]
MSRDPYSDLSIQIADFLHKNIQAALGKMEQHRTASQVLDAHIEVGRVEGNRRFGAGPDSEIEAKLGHVIDKNTRKRLSLPVTSETIVNNSYKEFLFESDMTKRQHKAFNDFLNSNVTAQSRVKYVHRYEIDQFLNVPVWGRVRRTIDENTRETKSCLLKTRMGNLDILMPLDPLDVRISVNLETTLQLDNIDDSAVSHSRKKDRVSYSLHPFQIDLTQVTNLGGHDDKLVLHEIEVEFTDPSELVDELKTHTLGSTHSARSIEYIDALLNNIRILARHKTS